MAITEAQIDAKIAEGVSEARRQAKIELMVESMHLEIHGNGQPGFIATTETKFNRLFAWKNKATGALAVVGSLAGFVGVLQGLKLLGIIS